MLNYHKTYRQSLEKFKRKTTPKKQPTINRSHTSSINLKLLGDASENLKSSFKQTKQNHDSYRKKEYIQHSKSKSNINMKQVDNQSSNVLNNFQNNNAQNTQMKYLFKIKDVQEFYDGSINNNNNNNNTSHIRLKTTYQQNPRNSAQQTTRGLITDRNTSRGIQYKLFDRSKSKKNVHPHHNNNAIVKTQYKQNYENERDDDLNNKFNNLCLEESSIRTKEKSKEHANNNNNLNKDNNSKDNLNKNIKDISTKHNTQSLSSNLHESHKLVKISISQLRKLYEKYTYYQNQVDVLHKQLNFYKKNITQYSKNSILLTLK